MGCIRLTPTDPLLDTPEARAWLDEAAKKIEEEMWRQHLNLLLYGTTEPFAKDVLHA